MAIKTTTQTFSTPKGLVEGVKVEWSTFSILLMTAPHGFLACGIFDITAINTFGRAAALVESTPDNPIGTLERFMERRVSAVNEKAREKGITIGMSTSEALELLF